MSSYVYASALVHERGLYVMTTWHRLAGWPAQTRIWDLGAPGPPSAPQAPPLWQRTYTGAVTPGGLAEAHMHVVEQCKRGVIPAQAQAQDVSEEERCVSTLPGR